MRAIIQSVQPWAASIAIVVGALAISGVLLRSQFLDRYEVSSVIGADGNPMTWRVNSRTGDVQLCSMVIEPQDPDDPFAKIFNPSGAPTLTARCRSVLGGGVSIDGKK